MYYSTTYSSPVGTMTLACHGDHLVGLWNEGQKYFGGGIPQDMTPGDDRPAFAAAKTWLDCYFAGERPPISRLALWPIGGAFRQLVWELLCAIPYGQVVTYGHIAKEVATKMGRSSMSSQAVGGAVGHNPISVIIPCHRVVGANGSLTGYAGGVATKIKLLELEGVDVSRFFVPEKGTAL